MIGGNLGKPGLLINSGVRFSGFSNSRPSWGLLILFESTVVNLSLIFVCKETIMLLFSWWRMGGEVKIST